jgi:hypothetical protein
LNTDSPKPVDIEGASELIIIDPDSTSGSKERKQTFAPHDDERKGLENKQFSQDIRERKRYAVAAFRLTRLWVCFLIISTLLQFVFSAFDSGLTEGMYIALVTTTTTSVLGVWALVGGYLFGFPKFKNDKMLDKDK